MHPLLPLLLSTSLLTDLDRPTSRSSLLDQDFGLGLSPESLYLSRYGYSPSIVDIYYRPYAEFLRQLTKGGGISSLKTDKNQFRIALDVQQFKPEEIEVKLVDDKYISIEAKHEEKKDEHGFVSRQFSRRYQLPERADSTQIKSTISSDGVLIIEVPLRPQLENKNEKKIGIQLTGKPALKPHGEQESNRIEDKPAVEVETVSDEPNTIEPTKAN